VDEVQFLGHTDVGFGRPTTDDRGADRGIFIIADGMGGHKGGEVASSMLVQEARAALLALGEVGADPAAEHQFQSIAAGAVRSAMSRASELIYNKSQTDSRLNGMGTTALVAKFFGSYAVVGHVGDSRAYLVRANKVYQLTEDHTLLNQLKARGGMSDQDIENFPHKSVLTRAVGREPTLEVDSSTSMRWPAIGSCCVPTGCTAL
jgi:protein phosphatase